MKAKLTVELDAHAPYPLRDFGGLRGLRDLPDPLVEAHLKLYDGYVKNVNLLRRRLRATSPGSPEWSEMKRRMGFELNGLRLHELYFEQLAPQPSGRSRELEETLAASWGSAASWKEEFEATAQMRGVGWVILYRDPADGRLSNHWIGLHEEGHPAGFTPLLVLDVWEHAFTGMTRSRYLEAFFANLQWDRVAARGSAS